MIASAIRNIISNAINYTENKGKIDIRILKKDNQVFLEIEDSGIGMDSDEIKNLFNYRKKDFKLIR